jgi:hypothetical protein
LPLAAEAVDAPAEDAPAADAPAVVPDALGELDDDDEHAAVTPSSNAAAAPAAGTDKDRFIPAPSRESRVRLPVPDGTVRAPDERAGGLTCLQLADRRVQLLATSRKHMG